MLRDAKLFTGKTEYKKSGTKLPYERKVYHARAHKAPVKPKVIAQAPITPKAFTEAVRGSRGLQTEIARRLGCSWLAVHNILLGKTGKGPVWDKARLSYRDEVEGVGDLAERTIHDAMEQRLDIATASRTALSYAKMKLKSRGFQDETKMTVDGNVNVQHTVVPIDKLNLPLDVRKSLLQAIQKWEKSEGKDE